MSVPRRVLTTAVAVAVTAGLPACTHTSALKSAPVAERGSEPSSVSVLTRVTRVAGDLPAPRRRSVEKQVDAVVERYLAAAFLGDHPRGRVPDLPGFTSGAGSLAKKDAAVLTGVGFTDADRVTAGTVEAYVTVVAPRRRAVGATARISVPLTVHSAGRGRQVTLAGRLLLTPSRQGWRIFGYHLSRSGSGGSTS